jgi:hypothetical protein
MLLAEGDKILVAHRRLFERDEIRFFLGRVDALEYGIVKVTGHSYVRDVVSGNVIKKVETRTKLLSLSSGTLIVYQLPEEVSLAAIQFLYEEGQLSVTDGKEFTMDLSEFNPGGRA